MMTVTTSEAWHYSSNSFRCSRRILWCQQKIKQERSEDDQGSRFTNFVIWKGDMGPSGQAVEVATEV